MTGCKGLTAIVPAAAVAIGLSACSDGSDTPGRPAPTAEETAAATARAVALVASLDAARARAADGSFDDTAYMVAPSVEAASDGTTVSVAVSEAGTP